ncbi:hypothetical protein GGR26_000841 [Lewinella marina]|uniref:CHRD domain-containing protein n=1 Tax=Neolewinella marina TaxID=438751 RepID=A0A2G0CIG0_9BACT|nr:CHRD domain-containing protein [Neolewinella marina]NJB85096.1 hypothetical protein [Neolewinella marina]PHK99765.1 hypothetical protein CGL56_01570 [Neolewinella marina]
MRTPTQYPLLLGLLFLFSATAFAQLPPSGTARLSGQQEVLPVATAATGTVDVTFEELEGDEVRITVSGSFENLSSPMATEIGGGAHLHLAYPGRNGGVVLPLVVDLEADSLSGAIREDENTIVLPAERFAGVDLGGAYVNIHSRNYPSGELRGIVAPAGSDVYYANLLGSNEVPAVTTAAQGAVLLVYDAGDNTLTVTGSFDNLTDTLATDLAGGAHLHIGKPGRNGPVSFPLTATLDADRRGGIFHGAHNTFSPTLDDLFALREGDLYANVHSGAYRSGEIRGQVLPRADVLFRAHLAGANEWPPVTTDASGQVLGHLAGNTLRMIGSFAGLESPLAVAIAGGAHVHAGWAGENGAVLFPLDPLPTTDLRGGSFAPGVNAFTLTDDERQRLIDRGMYVNIHATLNPSGEIRGQLLPESQAVFTAFLNGNQEIPAVTTSGRGMVKVEWSGHRMIATGSFQGLGSDLNTAIAGGSHLHAGYPGQSGPVVYPLTATQDDGMTRGRYLPGDNHFALTGGRTDSLTDRFFYVNVHSLDYPGGEIRGSVLAEAESYFLAPLSGASEPQGVPTSATGMVALEVRDSSVVAVGSFQNLDSDYAANIGGGMHLHQALAGSNGGIVSGLNTEIADGDRAGTIEADSNRIQLTAAQYAALRDRRVYANVHTADHPGGAIRGQLLPLAQNYFHTTFSGLNEAVYVASTAQGGLKLELVDSTLRLSGSVTNLDGDFDASIGGGAHLHLGGAGQNGGVVIPINATAADDLKGATFTVADNTFQLTEGQVEQLRHGRWYANIHTTEVPSGEARGQILAELNRPPAASNIMEPADGADVELSGAANQEFRVTYATTTDPDRDTVVYIWQVSTNPAFDNIIFAENTGRDTFFTTDFATVDTLLAANGVAVGNSVTIYHRVLASDGSNHRAGPGASVTLTRGDLVGIREYLPAGFAARTFPNPVTAGQALTVELVTREAFAAELTIHNTLGHVSGRRKLEMAAGSQRLSLPTEALPAGTYFLTLRHGSGALIFVERLLVH